MKLNYLSKEFNSYQHKKEDLSSYTKSQSLKNWSKVRNVLKGISLMHYQEVTEIKDVKQLQFQVQKRHRSKESMHERTSVISTGPQQAKMDDDAFQQFDRVHALSLCCEAGGE